MLPGIAPGEVRFGTLTSHATGGGTTHAIPYPTGVRPDDVVAIGWMTSSAALITSLGGSWIDDCRHSGTADTLIPSIYVAHMKAGSALTGNVTLTMPNVDGRGRIIAVPGVDLANILDTAAATTFKDQTAAQTTIVVPAGTATRCGDYLIGFIINNSGAQTFTQPGSWTEDNDGDGTVPFNIAHFSQTASGTTGTMTWTNSGSAKAIGQVLLFKARTNNPQLLAA